MHKLYFDGASRGNPGPASYGGVIYKPDGTTLLTYKKAIGYHTNNVAEYLGLIVGLRHCIDQKINNVAVYGDSKLVVEQTMGNWKVKSENLIHLQNEVKKYLQCINNISITHIYRKHNKVADGLANEALDS
jgi:probable phosphoglycerate mutase